MQLINLETVHGLFELLLFETHCALRHLVWAQYDSNEDN